MDIKELALKIAEEMGGNLYTLMDRCEDFATRFLAAYLKEQEPVAMIDEFGVFKDLTAGYLPEGTKLFTAPPLPALPDGMVMVWRKVTEEGKCVLATPGNYRTYQDQLDALIAAGEVKP